jgi:hypothetical protein
MTHDVEYYEAELGFPICNLPKSGYPMTYLDVANVLRPLLVGVEALLSALVEAHAHGAISHEAAGHALELLTGQMQAATHVHDRWYAGAGESHRRKMKTEPTRGS